MPTIANLTPSWTFDLINRPRPQFQLNVGGTLYLAAFKDSTQDVVQSATISVFQFGGSGLPTPVVNAACSIDANGTMSYALAGSNCGVLPGYDQAYAPWTANWKFTTSVANGALAFQHLTMFDVVQWPVANVVRQSDLQNHEPDLLSTLFTTETTAQAYIDLAFEDVCRRIEQAGNRPFLYINSEDLRRPTEYLALSKFFRARRKEKGDKWDMLFHAFDSDYEDWFTSTKFIYNISQTGWVTPNEVNRPNNQPFTRT